MTSKSTIARPLLALSAALVAAPLAAQAPLTVTGEHRPVYQERVSLADLDLRQWSAQQMLKRRVRRASEGVCVKAEGAANHDQPSFHGGPSCDEQTYLDARPQIRAAIARAKSGQQQLATALVVSASRVR